jgi:hypothetical protein
MTGTTNQVQTPFGSGVPTALALNPGVAGGISSLPANPGISYTGTLYGPLFTVWQNAIISPNGYTTPLVVANYDNAAGNGSGQALPTLTTLNLGTIQQINNGITGTIATLTSFVANSLVQINTDFSATMVALTTLTLPLLQYTGGNFSVAAATLPGALSLPQLQYVGNSFGPVMSVITSISAPNLIYCGLNCGGICPLVTSIDYSSLQYVGGLFNGTFAALTTLNLPAIVRILQAVSLTTVSLVTFSFGSTLKQIGNNVLIQNAALNQASVDGILVSLAALDGTNGTTAWSNLTVNLSGGTSSTPSATGLAAKATLVGRGCTVTTN